MTFGSLFSGIGGIDLGLERAGMKCQWQVEIDPFCRKVLAKHWPDVRRYEDVKRVGSETLEPVDVIAGGFPCQDVSVAGKRAGIKEGTRSGLWFEFHRIICELRPRYVFVENVPGLLADGMGIVLADLAESGYDAEWEVLSAADVGAPHLRKRVFIIAYPGIRQQSSKEEVCSRGGESGICGDSTVADPEGREDDKRKRRKLEKTAGRGESIDSPAGTGGEDVADASRSGLQGAELSNDDEVQAGEGNEVATGAVAQRSGDAGGNWAVEPDVGRVAHGVPSRVDRLKGLGNAVVPQCAEWIGRQIARRDYERRGRGEILPG